VQTNSNLILDKIIRKPLLDCLFLLVFYLAKKLDCIWEWDENKIKKLNHDEWMEVKKKVSLKFRLTLKLKRDKKA